MSLLARLFARPRLFDEVRFALGAALIGGLAGLLLAVLALPPVASGFPTSPSLAPWVGALAPAAGLGWWGGLVWAVALALQARRGTPVPVRALTTATWLAASVVVACGAAGPLLRVHRGWSLVAGMLAGTWAARVWLSRSCERSRG